MSASLPIPEELVEQLERRNVVPLLGAGLAQGQDGEVGLPSQRELATGISSSFWLYG